MRQIHKTIVAVVLGLLATAALSVQAQSTDNARFLSLAPPDGLPIIPVMEGWIANADGTTSFSFGNINRNEEAVDIPLGENNYIEPAKYNGMQPTHFPAGRTTGRFTVTVPAEDQEIDVWWYLKTGASEVLKVPGRRGAAAYELDFIRPRPQGAMQPMAGFGEYGAQAAGLFAQVADFPGSVIAGMPVTLTVNVMDPSDRDPTDPRFGEPLAVGVEFSHYQGAGVVEFAHHESTVAPEPPDEDDRRFRFYTPPEPGDITVAGGNGLARVIATFSEPGQYMIHVKVDNFKAPDSSNGDQCCWTNMVMRVDVTP